MSDSSLLAPLEQLAPGSVRTRASDRLGMAHDASHYLLTPQAVVVANDAAHVGALMRASAQLGLGVTFRSGGTSLSGQAGTDHLLVDVRRNFRNIEILDNGDRVRVQPGAVLRQVNARLSRYGRKLGPDPASEAACTVGGVVANNSSGMTCGTHANAYRTCESMTLVLPSGTVIDTAAGDADARLRHLEPGLTTTLEQLRDRIRGNPDSVRRIAEQYAMKNTMGYGLNSFLDHDTPVQILAHLIIGSEGTLGFVAEAVFRTVPVHHAASTGLIVFNTLHTAMAAMPELVDAGPAAIELLDAESLRVAQLDTQADAALRGFTVDQHAALLVEWQEADDEQLTAREEQARRLSTPPKLSRDPAGRAALWHIRKGLYATVAGNRPTGSVALLEDVAVPVPALAGLCDDLNQLFDRHRYERSVIFGHAKDGNLHFMLNEQFGAGDQTSRYAAFTEEMVDAVLARGGTLKAEHGTGRVMAPFVRRQFGDELFEVMQQVKRACDPAGLLNPGVLLTDDPQAHLRHLKPVVTVEAEVDRCVECGYCEPVCPSRDLTTTPRQRIVLRRELAMARSAGDATLAGQLEREYQYEAVDTCAVDGMCATACPVGINTGDLTRRLRADANGRIAERVWTGAARHWDAATRAMNIALDAAAVAPPGLVEAVTRVPGLPSWSRDLPVGGGRRRAAPQHDADAVYLPSCLNTMFAPAAGGAGVMTAIRRLAQRAGLRLHIPEGIGDLCCGTPWSSKGLPAGYAVMRDRVRAAVAGTTLPVIIDAASCTEGFHKLLDDSAVIDAVAFTAEHILPRLTITHRLPSLALHPTCSSTRLGLDAAITRIAEAIAERVEVPHDWQCCAFAGDRGLLHPELTASATRAEADAVNRGDYATHASVNRTCEIGLTRATGHPYHHLLELLDTATGSPT
ncbi:FAD-binding and (Fe-S)-binding domain-containing protein [Dactylosporangium sp. NPDC006015]|uniref:FAD-binding and (Fe-S)-binding domain-containing protein n=1 Tax=Dactylosporangium sp. NPDC006015 TaxID=3154576 RepID=UPI0033AF57D6